MAIHTHISSVFEIKMAVDNVLEIVIDYTLQNMTHPVREVLCSAAFEINDNMHINASFSFKILGRAGSSLSYMNDVVVPTWASV